jgi:hypothetical protein
VTPPEETDFKCKAKIGTEGADGGIVETMKMVDLNIIFHPLEGSAKAQTTEFIVKVDGVDTDLNEIFEPVASGAKIPMDTKYSVGTTDLRDIFAGKNTIPADLKLKQLPRGDFTCDTYLKLYYDRSGSMEDSFPYIDKAVTALESWFSKTFYGDTAAGRALAKQYVTVMNPAAPWEQTMTWIAAAVDDRTAGREVSIAYINESDAGGTGHPGSSVVYAKRWKALTNAGGCKHAAIMGVWHPWYRYYPGELKAQINQVIFEEKALKDMNVSGFFDIQDHTPTSKHVEIIANWLNIPTKPEHLTIVVNAFESDEHNDKVQWTLSSEICGLTHVPGADPAAFTKTQKCWKIEVKDENDLIVDTVTDLAMRPETHTYETAKDEMTDFYCRLTAVGETDYDDKVGEWVLCKKIKVEKQRRAGTPAGPACEIYDTDAFWLTQTSSDNIVAPVTYNKQQYRTLIVADPDNGTTVTAALPGPFDSLPTTNKYSIVGRYQTGIHTVYPLNTDLPDLYNYQSNTTISMAALEVEVGTASTTTAINAGDISVNVDSIDGAGIGNRFSITDGVSPIQVAGVLSDISSNTISWDGPPSSLGIGPGALVALPSGSTVTYKEYQYPAVATDKHLCTAHAANLTTCNFTDDGFPKRGLLVGELQIGNQLSGDPSYVSWVDKGLTAAHKQWLTDTYINSSQWQYSTSTWQDPWSGTIRIYAIQTKCPEPAPELVGETSTNPDDWGDMTPSPLAAGCPEGPKVEFCSGILLDWTHYGGNVAVFTKPNNRLLTDWLTPGDYSTFSAATPNSNFFGNQQGRTLHDGFALDTNTRLVIWSKPNFEGDIIFDEVGPMLINHSHLNGFHTSLSNKWSNSALWWKRGRTACDGRQLDEVFQVDHSSGDYSKLMWSADDHCPLKGTTLEHFRTGGWKDISMKIREVK